MVLHSQYIPTSKRNEETPKTKNLFKTKPVTMTVTATMTWQEKKIGETSAKNS